MAATTTDRFANHPNSLLGNGVSEQLAQTSPSWPVLTDQIFAPMDAASFLDHSHHHHHHQHQQPQRHHHHHHHQHQRRESEHPFQQLVAPLTPDMYSMGMPPPPPSPSSCSLIDTTGCSAFGPSYETAASFTMDAHPRKPEMLLPPTPEVSTASMSPTDGVTEQHPTAYVLGAGACHDASLPFGTSDSNGLFSAWSSPTSSSEEEGGGTAVDYLQHPITMTRDQLIGRVLALEQERRHFFTPMMLDVPESPTTTGTRLDSGERYFCHWEGCSMQAGQLAELIQHIRHVHVGSGKQAYYCKWAGCSRQDKPFLKRHKMHNHIRTHTGEKPFACNVQDCDKRFSRLDSLKTHMKTHLPVRPHLCPEHGCNKAYFHARSLRKHLKSHVAARHKQHRHD